MKDTRSRNLLVTLIDNIKQYLSAAGWNVLSSFPASASPKDVFVDEFFPEEKVTCNMVAVGFTDIREPLPVELGNSMLVKQTRDVAVSVVGMKENIAQAIALDVKSYFDNNRRIEYFDGNNQLIGYVWVLNTSASKVYSASPVEWRKYWWMAVASTEEYFDLGG